MDITIEDILDETAECGVDVVDSTVTSTAAADHTRVSESARQTPADSSTGVVSAPPAKKIKMAGQTSTATVGTGISGSSGGPLGSKSTPSAKKAKKGGAKSKLNPSKSDRTTVGQKTKPFTNEKKQNTLAKVAAAKERANEMFSAITRSRLPSISSSSSSDDELTDDEHTYKNSGKSEILSNSSKKLATSSGQALKDQLESQRLLIKSLQKQLNSRKCK